MRGFVAQDWLTIRRGPVGGPGPYPTIVQGQPFWLDLSDYRDVIAWVQVSETFIDAGQSVQLTFETAPTEDEMLFVAMAGPINLTTGVTVTQMLADLSQPLAKFFRWKLAPNGPTTTPWDVSFRILIAVNRPGYRTPSNLGSPSNPPLKMGSASSQYSAPWATSSGSSSATYAKLPMKLPKK